MTDLDKLIRIFNPIAYDPASLDRWFQQHDAHIAATTLENFRPKCPYHGIPDCSPLLNGCNIPVYLHNQLQEAARLLREKST